MSDTFYVLKKICYYDPKSPMEKRAHIFVSGRVQGVFFRDHTQRWASSLGLTGWVRNLYDGRVEAVVEGGQEKIEELITKLKQGPPMADVTNVNISWENFVGEFEGFRITW
jgi:acylphosphatase